MADNRSRSTSFHSASASGPAPQAWPAARVIKSASGIRRTATPERKSRSPVELRHGSGAGAPTPVSEESPQGSRGRERSRDRPPSKSAQARLDQRTEEEQIPRKTLAAIDRLEITVAALEQASRNHAHTISKLDASYVEIQNRVNDMANTLSDTMTKSRTTENNLLEACGNIIDRFQSKSTHSDDMRAVDGDIGMLRAKLRDLENAVASAVLVDTPAPPQQPKQTAQVFNVSTPSNSHAQPDPWQQYRDGAHAQAPPPNNPGSPGSFGPDANDYTRAQASGPQYPEVPAGWTQDPNSIFGPLPHSGAPGMPQPGQPPCPQQRYPIPTKCVWQS